MGFPLVIEDFSMGHTSLKYLQRNEFDMVKLDGSLVREINGNSRCNDIVGSIVSLSGTLNFIVMGECVETKEEQLSLEQLGCVHYQGYLYSPAVPFEEFLELLRVSRISG
jgi:EAL domain-containing protein (putative c-di-GMP-specific phosphodiesterase class I)